MRDFAENRNLSKISSNVVVQVFGDARSHSFERKQLRHAISVQRISDDARQCRSRSDEPPSLPDYGPDCKRETCGHVAHRSVGVDRPHEEAIAARREIGEVNRALVRGPAPILARAFELILVTQPFARAEVWSHEVDL